MPLREAASTGGLVAIEGRLRDVAEVCAPRSRLEPGRRPPRRPKRLRNSLFRSSRPGRSRERRQGFSVQPFLGRSETLPPRYPCRRNAFIPARRATMHKGTIVTRKESTDKTSQTPVPLGPLRPVQYRKNVCDSYCLHFCSALD